MYRTLTLLDAKIVQEPTLSIYRLRPYSRSPGGQVITVTSGQKALEVAKEDPLA